MIDPVRILHLDDNPLDAELVALTLESTREDLHCVLTYVQTKEAYLVALERKEFDIILSDYRMPSFDGDEALAAALEKCPEIPFIMVTGELGEERVIETLQRGATDYVLKDRILRLVPAIRRALDMAELRRNQERAEAALRESQETLALAINATNLGLFDYYPKDGRLLWNSAAKSHFGLPPEAMVTYDVFLRGIHPEDRKRVEAAMQKALRQEETGNCRMEYRTSGLQDGVERWIDTRGQSFFDQNGEAVRFVGTTNDITARKLEEEELRRREARFRSLISSSIEPIALVDENGTVLAISHSAADLLGSTIADLVNSDVHHFVAPAQIEAIEKSLMRLRARPDVPQFVLMRLQLEDKPNIWVELEATGIMSGGEIRAYFFRLHPVVLSE